MKRIGSAARSRLLECGSVLTLAALLAAAGTTAAAQTASAGPGATNVEEVVVTATRVAREGYTAPTPTTSLSRDLLEAQAPVVISDVLYQIPSVRPSPNNTSTSQASGNYVNLRGFGATRTLTLVDGRRFVPSNGAENSGGSSVDLNLIPEALVDRIDVVTGGASAAWGSDAIGGVVNLILKRSMEGVEGKVQYGASQYGDAKSFSASLAGGTSFADGRGQLMVAGEYSRTWDMPTAADRDYSRGQCAYMPGSIGGVNYLAVKTCGVTNNGYTNGGVIVDSGGNPLSPTNPLYGRQFLSPTSSSPFNYGQIGSLNRTLSVGGDGGWKGADSVWVAPLTRKSVYGRVLYELAPNVNAFLDGSFGESGTKVDLFLNSVSSATDTPIQIFAGNPYIPADVRAIMTANNIGSFYLTRLIPELGYDKTDSVNRVARVATGLEGKFGETWSWDAYLTFGHDWYDTEYGNNIIVSNFRAATDVVINPATGQPDCRINVQGPAAPGTAAYGAMAGCVPANPFGPGSMASAAGYLAGTLSQKSDYGQWAGGATLRGEPFSTWAGRVSTAFGLDYRKEWVKQKVSPYADFVNPPAFPSGGFQQSNPKSFSGEYTITEGFGEIVVPLLADQPFAKALDFNGAARVTHYSTSGTVTTWKYGATYKPVEGLLFRAAHSKDIRAASLFETFGSNTTYSTVTTRGPGGVATGTADVVSPGRSNENLDPENAITTTLGVTLQNLPINGLGLSVDAYRIHLKDTIGKLGPQGIIDRCFGGGTAAGHPPDAASCALISNNQTVVIDPFQNLGSIESEGVEFDLSYRMPADRLFSGADGQFTARLLSDYVARLKVNSSGLNERDTVGELAGLPHWRSTATLAYDSQTWGGSLQGRYVGEMAIYKDAAPNTYAQPVIPGYFYLDAFVRYNVINDGRRNVQLFANVKNLLNTDPPFAPGSGSSAFFGLPARFGQFLRYSNVTYYDVIGRSFFVGARFNF
jgi:outer membrane receptor protein involved in Fe transport